MDKFVLEQRDSGTRDHLLGVILIVAFIALFGICSTFAFMKWQGNQTPNRFTTDKGLTVDLVEPSWTSAVASATGDYPNVASDGKTVIPAAANNFSSSTGGTADGRVAKDPYVVNTSMVGNEGTAGSSAYVGIRITLQKWVASGASGFGKDHKEEGKYVTMTDDEAKAFWKCFSLNEKGDVSKKTGDSAGQPYGVTLGKDSGWKQYNSEGTDITNTAVSTAQQYFVYTKGIKSVGKEITGNYPEAGNTEGTATSKLFNYVQLVDDGDLLGDFISVLKDGSGDLANSTTDPGWRILVDVGATDCTSGSEDTNPDTARIKYLVSDDAYQKVDESGASPSSNKYWNDKTNTRQGTGYGVNAINVPESNWSY
jgi:hypothetical protein